MLDLDLLMDNTIDIKIGGKMVKVNEPSFYLVRRVSAFAQKMATMKEEELCREQTDILLKFLNSNTSNRKFTERDITNLTPKAMEALFELLAGAIAGIENNPN